MSWRASGCLLLGCLILFAVAAEQGHEVRAPGIAVHKPARRRKHVLAVVGVMTAFQAGEGRYDYARRRELLRQTWFPKSEAEIWQLQKELGLVVRFVVGEGDDAAQEEAIRNEEEQHGKFIRLPFKEGYRRLYLKTQLFWKAVVARWTMEYVFKVDDDKYVRLDRLPHAIQQWRARKAEYIGCFQFRYMFRDPNVKWYDPNHKLIGKTHDFDGGMYAEGPFYVLAGHIVQALAHMPLPFRVYGGNEDIATGMFLRGFDINMWDDPRVCDEGTCSASTIALNVAANQNFPASCTVEEMDNLTCFMKIHQDPNCQLPTLDSNFQLPERPPRHDLEVDQAWIDAI